MKLNLIIKACLNRSRILIIILGSIMFSLASCVDLVQEGIEVSYLDSDATVKVEPIDFEQGAAGETISYSIEVTSNHDIKSCIVKAATQGRNGSGFNVSDTNFDDPFADHIFGTVREGIRSFKVRYDYIIPDETSKSRISFTIIDDSGKASMERTVDVVPAVSKYTDLKLFARDNLFNDALATVDGQVYPDIKSNYSQVTEANVDVQEKIDIIFFYDKVKKRATIAAPASGNVDLELTIENQTLFKKLDPSERLELDQFTPALLQNLTAEASILAEGSPQISNIKVGDIIGFITDLNAVNSLKSGVLIVTGLHPATVDRYEGVSYVLECEMVVQK